MKVLEMLQIKRFGSLVWPFNPYGTIHMHMYASTSSVGSKTLFIGGISNRVKEEELRDAFSSHGEVIEARLCIDPRSSCSCGYGFLQYSSLKEAEVAMKMMNGKVLKGKRIRVAYAVSEQKDVD